jgi:hypothetical protein
MESFVSQKSRKRKSLIIAELCLVVSWWTAARLLKESMGTSSKRHAVFLRLVVFIVLLGLSSGFGFAQAQPRANPQQSSSADSSQQETATFRASTRLVLVDLVVTDKNGQTVKGLKAIDFTVLEDGKPQPVRAFESHVWQRIAAPVEKIKLPPNQYTNFTEREPNNAATSCCWMY